MNPDPKVDPRQATLIDPVALHKAAQEGQAKIEATKKQEADRKWFEAWERAGQRAFKGIYSRPIRRMFLKDAARRMEREAAEDGER